ncbi:MAG: FkbM family methyltransferase [Paracoccaceae bacterium]
MSKARHALQRSLDASLRYRLLSRDQRDRMANALNALRPYTSDQPLIRVGPDADGGYLLPDVLNGIAASFSPGVSFEFGFDLDLLARGIPVHMADASVGHPENLPEGATFDPLFLGAETTGQWTTLQDWVDRHAASEGDLMLQMDIEGHEYDVLNATPADTLARFRIMVIEFHHLHRFPRSAGFDRFESALSKLSRDFVCVHLHPNNVVHSVRVGPHHISPFFEATLLRRDLATGLKPNDSFPHPLDRPCAPDHPDVPIGVFWS